MSRRASSPISLSAAIAGAVFVVGVAAIAFAAAWPIYQTWLLLVPTLAGLVLGAGIAAAGAIWGWSWWLVVCAAVLAYLTAGVPAAFPGELARPTDLPGAWLGLVEGTVLSWKQLVTISLPVGAYQSLFVPPFLLFLAASTAALSLLWRTRRLDVLAVPIMLLLPFFGLVFGSSAVSDTAIVAGYPVSAPREVLLGLAGFIASVVFLSHRARTRRAAALRVSASQSGVHQGAGGWSRRLRRSVLSVAAVLVAILVAVPALALPVQAQERDVLRTAIDPDLELRDYPSPLSEYRASFSDDAYDTELLSVAPTDDAPTPDRLRMAVMSYYDGEVYRVIDPDRGDDAQDTAFARTPGVSAGAAAQRATVTVGAYDGVWLPVAGRKPAVVFDGARSQGLTDGYFFNDRTDAGIQLGGLRPGDRYTISAPVDTDATLDGLGKPGASDGLVSADLIPESLRAWIEAQDQPDTGAGLQELLRRLSARGYLSHALSGATGAAWVADLGGDYAFQPSLSGHSVDRIDALFTALLEKQTENGGDDDAALVAAPGDDEQFAVAAALIAQELGFRSRVVLGFVLNRPAGESADAASATPVCTDGRCTGRDLAAWVEVGGSGENWVPVDVTPQHVNPIAPRTEQTSDPQLTSDVQPHNATEQAPEETRPDGTGATDPNDDEAAVDLTWLFTLLRVGGIVLLALLLLASPAIVVLGAKASRRRSRRKASDPTASIAGAWEDFVDTAVDLGLPTPGARTRTELAAEYGSPNGHRLALLADAAVFGGVAPGAADSAAFWELTTAESALLTAEFGRWDRIRGALSIRSFARFLGTGRVFGNA